MARSLYPDVQMSQLFADSQLCDCTTFDKTPPQRQVGQGGVEGYFLASLLWGEGVDKIPRNLNRTNIKLLSSSI